MGKAAIRLPKKLYFTLEEIAKRWNCEENTIRHYIDEGMLRPSIESKELDDAWLFHDPEGMRNGGPRETLAAWRHGSRYAKWIEKPDKVTTCYVLPRFVYFNARHRLSGSRILARSGDDGDGLYLTRSTPKWGITVVETFEGKEFAIAGDPMQGQRGPVVYEPHRLDITERYESPFITCEERDRFEREHDIVVDGQEAPAKTAEPQQEAPAGDLVFPYATRELEAMREAVRLHWEDYTPDKRQPTQKEIAYTLGELLGLPTQGDGTPARKAHTLAAAIKPDTLPDT